MAQVAAPTAVAAPQVAATVATQQVMELLAGLQLSVSSLQMQIDSVTGQNTVLQRTAAAVAQQHAPEQQDRHVRIARLTTEATRIRDNMLAMQRAITSQSGQIRGLKLANTSHESELTVLKATNDRLSHINMRTDPTSVAEGSAAQRARTEEEQRVTVSKRERKAARDKRLTEQIAISRAAATTLGVSLSESELRLSAKRALDRADAAANVASTSTAAAPVPGPVVALVPVVVESPPPLSATVVARVVSEQQTSAAAHSDRQTLPTTHGVVGQQWSQAPGATEQPRQHTSACNHPHQPPAGVQEQLQIERARLQGKHDAESRALEQRFLSDRQQPAYFPPPDSNTAATGNSHGVFNPQPVLGHQGGNNQQLCNQQQYMYQQGNQQLRSHYHWLAHAP
ncbi:MAG: hypothetical protein WDW36_010283 [Sanguina aurantia]